MTVEYLLSILVLARFLILRSANDHCETYFSFYTGEMFFVNWNVWSIYFSEVIYDKFWMYPLYNLMSENLQIFLKKLTDIHTSWQVSKYGTFSGLYFPLFGLNTEIYGINLRIQSEYRKIRTRKTPYFKKCYCADLRVINI